MAKFEEGPEPKIIGQIDFLDNPEKSSVKPIKIGDSILSKTANVETGDKYVCPECENYSRSCAHCHGRNYGFVSEN